MRGRVRVRSIGTGKRAYRLLCQWIVVKYRDLEGLRGPSVPNAPCANVGESWPTPGQLLHASEQIPGADGKEPTSWEVAPFFRS